MAAMPDYKFHGFETTMFNGSVEWTRGFCTYGDKVATYNCSGPATVARIKKELEKYFGHISD